MFKYHKGNLSWRPNFSKYGNGNEKDGKHHFKKLKKKLFDTFGRKNIINLESDYLI